MMERLYRSNVAIIKRNFSQSINNSKERLIPVCLIRGDGIGPEICESVMRIFSAAKVPIEWKNVEFMPQLNSNNVYDLPKELIDTMKSTKIGLKAPITTPIAKGYRSVNLQIRKRFDLYANIRPCKTIADLQTKYGSVDLVIIRENTEGEYCGIEHKINDDIAQSVKIITARGSERIAKFAFEYALKTNRHLVTACHKANIMRLTDGLFLKSSWKVANDYRSRIKFNESHIDTTCFRLVNEPFMFDILLSPNLYGDILSDLCSGLIGGLGLSPSANMGDEMAIFEAVHGSAPDIAGKDLANPTALILSALMMLDHLELTYYTDIIRNSLFKVLKRPEHRTRDLGGKMTCSEFTNAIIKSLKN